MASYVRKSDRIEAVRFTAEMGNAALKTRAENEERAAKGEKQRAIEPAWLRLLDGGGFGLPDGTRIGFGDYVEMLPKGHVRAHACAAFEAEYEAQGRAPAGEPRQLGSGPNMSPDMALAKSLTATLDKVAAKAQVERDVVIDLLGRMVDPLASIIRQYLAGPQAQPTMPVAPQGGQPPRRSTATSKPAETGKPSETAPAGDKPKDEPKAEDTKPQG